MVRLLLTTALAAAPILWAGAVAAQCVPSAPFTATCTGTDPDGFLFGASNGLTVTVEPGATVTNAANARGIELRDSGNITMNGTVSTTGADAINVRDTGTVLVQGTITATGASADGVDARDALDLDLFGTITAGKDGVNARNNANIFLGSTARITAGDEGLQLGNSATVSTNAGSVIEAADEGIEAGNDATVTIRGTLTAFDDALNVGERANITNLGRIANIQTQANINAGDEAQDGVDLDSGVVNNGGFTGFTSNANAEISSTFGDAIDFDPSTNLADSVIDNYALIKGGNRAVETDVLNVRGQWVINRATGRIIGNAADGIAMNLGAGADRYDHFAGATLSGGIDFGTGDDMLQIFGLPTGRLGGAGAVIEGGAGTDTVVFDSVAFDQIAGTVSGTTIDFRLGTGPDPFLARLANFELFTFAGDDAPRTFAEVARKLGDPSVVPLPASALLLLGGLGGLAALRRRNAGRAGVSPVARIG